MPCDWEIDSVTVCVTVIDFVIGSDWAFYSVTVIDFAIGSDWAIYFGIESVMQSDNM
jgi:hypothetical protein